MYTLFIDTHQKTTIAIIKDTNLLKSATSEELKQSTVIIPLIKKLLHQCKLNLENINKIIVINGPGSFTGVRLGVTIAKTIAFTLNIPVKKINTLELIAVMDDFKNNYYGVADTKGMYLGEVIDKALKLSYKKSSEINDLNIVTDLNYDYNKLMDYEKKLEITNPHMLNPIYVKKIEAQK